MLNIKGKIVRENLSKNKRQEICSYLAETAKMMNLELVRDISSIATLEDILLGLKSTDDNGAISGAAYMSGIYLGEILIGEIGRGGWQASEEFGQIGVVIDGEMLFPLAKIKKFLDNPSDDGLTFYAKALVAKKSNG